ncbi:MAG: hypothetical protein K6C35_01840 [Eubacterium sp.]|nr:hypothetical protein [Eubacterium sp.]
MAEQRKIGASLIVVIIGALMILSQRVYVVIEEFEKLKEIEKTLVIFFLIVGVALILFACLGLKKCVVAASFVYIVIQIINYSRKIKSYNSMIKEVFKSESDELDYKITELAQGLMPYYYYVFGFLFLIMAILVFVTDARTVANISVFFIVIIYIFLFTGITILLIHNIETHTKYGTNMDGHFWATRIFTYLLFVGEMLLLLGACGSVKTCLPAVNGMNYGQNNFNPNAYNPNFGASYMGGNNPAYGNMNMRGTNNVNPYGMSSPVNNPFPMNAEHDPYHMSPSRPGMRMQQGNPYIQAQNNSIGNTAYGQAQNNSTGNTAYGQTQNISTGNNAYGQTQNNSTGNNAYGQTQNNNIGNNT